MKASEEFEIRMRKAKRYLSGAKELGLANEIVVREIRKLLDDDDLIDRMYDEDEKLLSGNRKTT